MYTYVCVYIYICNSHNNRLLVSVVFVSVYRIRAEERPDSLEKGFENIGEHLQGDLV